MTSTSRTTSCWTASKSWVFLLWNFSNRTLIQGDTAFFLEPCQIEKVTNFTLGYSIWFQKNCNDYNSQGTQCKEIGMALHIYWRKVNSRNIIQLTSQRRSGSVVPSHGGRRFRKFYFYLWELFIIWLNAYIFRSSI